MLISIFVVIITAMTECYSGINNPYRIFSNFHNLQLLGRNLISVAAIAILPITYIFLELEVCNFLDIMNGCI